MGISERLAILADAAKYDASCASSGSKSTRAVSKLGTTEGMGICHSYTPDGRCISLLKLLLTNHCIYDCQYCVNLMLRQPYIRDRGCDGCITRHTARSHMPTLGCPENRPSWFVSTGCARPTGC